MSMGTLHRGWVFQANPGQYDVVAMLAELTQTTWTARQHKTAIRAGDSVFIWGSGGLGVLAHGTVLTDPALIASDPRAERFWRKKDKEEEAKDAFRVQLQFTSIAAAPIALETLRGHPTLRHMQVVRRPFGGTNFPLRPHETQDLLRLCQGDQNLPKTWVVGTGSGGEFWEAFQRSGCIRIGFRDIDIDPLGKSHGDIANIIRSQTNGEDRRNDALALYEFANVLAPGDRVVAKVGLQRVLGLGEVTSGYYRDSNDSIYRHRRDVTWQIITDASLDGSSSFARKTLTHCPSEQPLFAAIFDALSAKSPPPPGALPSGPPRPPSSPVADIWREKKNIILYGPPGTGKTWEAKKLTRELIGQEDLDPERYTAIQFHQNSTYEDVVQGWRPHAEDGARGGFTLGDGVILRACERARQDLEKRPHVLEIDEMNRGNVSAILGELLGLIEGDKRSEHWARSLLYSPDKRFHVPENLYIIGMMNTADRSLAWVDYALRRRFAFFEIEPQFTDPWFKDHLRGAGISPELADHIVSCFKALNRKIADDGDFGRGFKIGHSFFIIRRAPLQDEGDWYRRILNHEIKPLLEEYCRDARNKYKAWTEGLAW